VNKKKIIWFALVSVLQCILMAKVTLQDQSSVIQIDAGVTLTTENSIVGLNGTIKKNANATIEGAVISFDDGIFQDGDNKTQLTGGVDPSSDFDFVLDGNKLFSPAFGQVVKKIKIKDKNNKIEGQPNVVGDIILENNTSDLTYALNGRINSNIILNGGTLYLEQDLVFADDRLVTGSGTIVFNGRKLQLGNTEVLWNDAMFFDSGSDITLNANVYLSEVWTFSGSSIIEGNNQILYLQEGGEIVVDPDSVLLLKNIIINNVNSSNVRCVDSSGSLKLQNVLLSLVGDYVFAEGSFDCFSDVRISGHDAVFTYQSDQQSSIAANTRLTLDETITFSYDPIHSTLHDPILFADVTSQLVLNGATLHTTGTGMHIKKGKINIKQNSYFTSENNAIDEGIVLGGNNEADDCTCRIGIGATLRITQGSFSYKNIDPLSLVFGSGKSTIYLDPGTILGLHQTLNLGEGMMYFGDNVTIAYVEGVDIIGSSGQLGSLLYNIIT